MKDRTDTFNVKLADKYKAVVKTGESTLKALLIMNGGASIAFFGFIGKAMDYRADIDQATASTLTSALKWFIYGTFCAVLASGLIFTTNGLSYHSDRKIFTGIIHSIVKHGSTLFLILTIVAGACSLYFFVLASTQAVDGFKEVGRQLFSDGN